MNGARPQRLPAELPAGAPENDQTMLTPGTHDAVLEISVNPGGKLPVLKPDVVPEACGHINGNEDAPHSIIRAQPAARPESKKTVIVIETGAHVEPPTDPG